MRALLAACRVGLIEMAADFGRFWLLIVCLAVGTALIAGVATVGAAITQAVDENAALLMGGDLELTRADRAATDEELEVLSGFGTVAALIDTNLRAESPSGEAFVDLVAAGPDYPLLGTVSSTAGGPNEQLADLLGVRHDRYGVIAHPVMLDQLGLAPGDIMRLGGTDFEVRGSLASLPDAAVRGFRLGLTAVISTDGFAAVSDRTSPLPGLGTYFRYKLLLDDDGDLVDVRHNLVDALGPSGWEIRSALDGLGPMLRYYQLFMSFLVIVGLASLLIGGVSVWSSMSAYVADRAGVVAVLRSLGASRLRVLGHFLVQVLAVSAIGIGIGVSIGAGIGLILLPAIGDAVGIPLVSRLDPVAILIATGVGFVTAFAFSYLPLVQAQAVTPASLFRSRGLGAPPIDWRQLVSSGAVWPLLGASAAFIGLAYLLTFDIVLVLAFVGASVLAVGLIQATITLALRGLRRMPDPGFRPLRHALRTIVGSPANAAAVVVSVGLALATLVVVLVLGVNLRNEFLGASVFDAPTLVASDLFADEVEQLEALAAQGTDIARFTATPMLRGQFTALNGSPANGLSGRGPEASFLLSGEIPFTYRAELPASSRLVEGQWWSPEHEGEPLVSLHHNLRQGLGISLGDTLSFSIFGEAVTARVANFRDYSWQGGVDFLVTFSPSVLEGYPATLLGAVTAAPGREEALERFLAEEFQDVRFVAIGETLQQITRALSQLSFAAGAIGALAVSNGLLVLIGSLATGRRQREADAVLTKVLGATRGEVISTTLLQFGLLAAFAALLATPIGVGLAYVLTAVLLDVAFTVEVPILGLVQIGAIVITAVLGAAMLLRVLSRRPARLLREMHSV